MARAEGGPVSALPDKGGTAPWDYWQYWRNTEDGDVARFLKLFTVLPLEEIGRLAALEGQELNEAKKILATEITRLCHGAAAATEAEATARRTFEEGGKAESLQKKVGEVRADRPDEVPGVHQTCDRVP